MAHNTVESKKGAMTGRVVTTKTCRAIFTYWQHSDRFHGTQAATRGK